MASPKVLIVDDNKNYREAFRRNLLLQGYEVVEAEDSDEALQILGQNEMDVVVTDLSMRHPTEGLDLIRQARSLRPHLPIVMISAVGTFEEGAEASRLGACYVISKSKIDEEIDNLFKAIDLAYEEYNKNKQYIVEINQLAVEAAQDATAAVGRLREMVLSRDIAESVKRDAFDVLMNIDRSSQLQDSRQDMDRASSSLSRDNIFDKVESNLNEAIEKYSDLSQDTLEALRTAEYLYIHDEQFEKTVDFSRSIGFSYCFAVENEAKFRLRKRLQKFFNDPETPKLIYKVLEDNRRSVSLFFHQHLLRVQRGCELDVTIDNVFQTFHRILEHGGKYKPDGLKALGIVLICFGRTYKFRKFQQEIGMDNPLGLKGLDSEEEVIRFASLLTNLQHYRNPYIHPEISEMEKLSKIREATFDCLNLILRLV